MREKEMQPDDDVYNKNVKKALIGMSRAAAANTGGTLSAMRIGRTMSTTRTMRAVITFRSGRALGTGINLDCRRYSYSSYPCLLFNSDITVIFAIVVIVNAITLTNASWVRRNLRVSRNLCRSMKRLLFRQSLIESGCYGRQQGFYTATGTLS